MSPQRRRENNFPPLQKRIILHLAKSRPQTINETKNALSGHYKSTWTAFESLEKKGLIETVTSKEYRGRQFPCFWLTELGIYLALHGRAKPEALFKTTCEIYPDKKTLQFLIEAVPILGKHAFDILYLVALNKGAIEQIDLTSIFAAQTVNKLTPKQVRKFVTVLKKYPEQHQQTRKSLRELADLL